MAGQGCLIPRDGLLGFLVVRVLAAGVAELRKLEPAGGGFLVFGRRVVAVLADGALESDDFAHTDSFRVWPATSAGKQRVTRRDAG